MLGSIGVGYFIYGRKQGKAVPLAAGILLMIFPYFVSNPWWMIVVGVALMALPFLVG